MIQRHLITHQNVFALFGFAKFKYRAPPNHFDAVLDKQLDHLDQAQLARLPAYDRQQDHVERFLHLRKLVQIIQNELRFFAPLQLDDDAHAFARRFIPDVRNAFDFFRLHQLRDALNQPRLVHLVRNFSDNDVVAVFCR